MSQLAINELNSVYVEDDSDASDFGQLVLVDNTGVRFNRGEQTRQALRERLSTWQGEDFINRTFGIPYRQILGNDSGINFFITVLQREILRTVGVVSILDFTWGYRGDLESNAHSDEIVVNDSGTLSSIARQSRDFIVNFSVQALTGPISMSMNFGNGES